MSEYIVVLHCEGQGYEEFPYDNMEANLSEPFFTGRMKRLSTAAGLYGKLRVEFLHLSNVILKNEE